MSMMMKTLGGDRLGSGKRMKVGLHGYGRSNHNMSYVIRTSMSAGTLVPFLCELGLTGDTWDIDLDTLVKTHPTIGPLFGSYKVQLDVFEIPLRLYNQWLHNNKLKVGMNVERIKLPMMNVNATGFDADHHDPDNAQINPSALIKYLGISGVGAKADAEGEVVSRAFSSLWLIGYWDLYKNYYANKQEEIGVMVNTARTNLVETVTGIGIGSDTVTPPGGGTGTPINLANNGIIHVNYATGYYDPAQIFIEMVGGPAVQLTAGFTLIDDNGSQARWRWTGDNTVVLRWRYRNDNDITEQEIGLTEFPLDQIDKMRERIMATNGGTAMYVNQADGLPYNRCVWLDTAADPNNFMLGSQQGLGIKTYQSDVFNNWLNTDWIDGVGGIDERTAIDTSDGSFSMTTLIMAKKVFDLLNRVAVSGGSYEDYLEAVYGVDQIRKSETPIYVGGLSKELVFEEVVSNSESAEGQPLGTLAGKGKLAGKHKGGKVVIKLREPSMIMGIVSLTPRVDYSQGNRWWSRLQNMGELHVPELDEIGFQELITEQMAYWDTFDDGGTWVQKSAGKQPAWINYMTNYNRVYGNFAIKDNEGWMVLNRSYDYEEGTGIKDLTTYIDPSKYNRIFAETALDSQNFWVQIGVEATARRIMSAKMMPSL